MPDLVVELVYTSVLAGQRVGLQNRLQRVRFLPGVPPNGLPSDLAQTRVTFGSQGFCSVMRLGSQPACLAGEMGSIPIRGAALPSADSGRACRIFDGLGMALLLHSSMAEQRTVSPTVGGSTPSEAAKRGPLSRLLVRSAWGKVRIESRGAVGELVW